MTITVESPAETVVFRASSAFNLFFGGESTTSSIPETMQLDNALYDYDERDRELFIADDDGDFTDYVPSTVDPGDLLFVVALTFCVGSLLFMPVFVKAAGYIAKHSDVEKDDNILKCCKPFVYFARWKRRRTLRRVGRRDGFETLDRRRDNMARYREREGRESVIKHMSDPTDRSPPQANTNNELKNNTTGPVSVVHCSKAQSYDGLETGTAGEKMFKQAEMNNISSHRWIDVIQNETEHSAVTEEHLLPDLNKMKQEIDDELKNSKTRLSEEEEDSILTVEPTINLTPRGYFYRKVKFFWTIVRYDYESMRLLGLAVPFAATSVIDTVLEIIGLIIITQYLGTDSMIAYAFVDLLVGITDEFMGAWIEALSSLASMAYGAGNYERVGQYLQLSIIAYIICEIPMVILWVSSMGKILILLGFSSNIAAIAQEYIWVAMACDLVSGVHEAFGDFIEVVDHELYLNIFSIFHSLVDFACFAPVAMFVEGADLTLLGLVSLCVSSLFLCINIVICNSMGWLVKFEGGFLGGLAIKDKKLVMEMLKVALPLAFGNLLAYAEWEILTVFAAVMGPAEVTTWALLAYIWDLFEVITGSIGGAAEVRCSYQLGKGRPQVAKMVAYKSIFMAFLSSIVSTAIVISLRGFLPVWLSSDLTIQAMLSELFPLMALGDITMNIGMTCWTLLGAQGRYHFATSLFVASSVLVTIPLSTLLVFGFNINLQALVFSVLIGYAVLGTILSVFLFISDWESISLKIQAQFAAEEAGCDDDSDDSSSSSSSSSSGISED